MDTDVARLSTAEARVTASGLGDRDFETAMIAAELHAAGWQVRPPPTHGGQWWFTSPDGKRRLSLTDIRRLLRSHALGEKRCEECDKRLPPALDVDRKRGPRIDRRYCSSACRQRAYRARRSRS